MQIVILAAGRGKRMGELTEHLPKPLLEKNSKTLLEHKFDALPQEVDEIVLVVGYKGELIRKRFGDSYNKIPITYVEGPIFEGTAKALWVAKSVLKENFLVCMGDDIYSQQAFADCAKNIPSIACIRASKDDTGSRVVVDDTNKVTGFLTHKAYINNFSDGGMIFTGLYGLTRDIFDYEPVKLETRDEWGLPQTLLEYTKDHPVKIIEIDSWTAITSPDDLK